VNDVKQRNEAKNGFVLVSGSSQSRNSSSVFFWIIFFLLSQQMTQNFLSFRFSFVFHFCRVFGKFLQLFHERSLQLVFEKVFSFAVYVHKWFLSDEENEADNGIECKANSPN
jgi:hypothetical protein